MDLSGLLGGLLLDPAFARAARAEGPHGSVVTPDGAIPFLAAGLVALGPEQPFNRMPPKASPVLICHPALAEVLTANWR
jgi:hypothetical protein